MLTANRREYNLNILKNAWFDPNYKKKLNKDIYLPSVSINIDTNGNVNIFGVPEVYLKQIQKIIKKKEVPVNFFGYEKEHNPKELAKKFLKSHLKMAKLFEQN